MLLFGHCRDFKMHKNTRKEYIFYPACIGDGCNWCTKYSFQLVDQKEDKDRQGWHETKAGWRTEYRRWQKGRGSFKVGTKMWGTAGRWRCWPDGDIGALSQPASCALQPSVDLPHLYSPLQANHLQQLVTKVWMVTERVLETWKLWHDFGIYKENTHFWPLWNTNVFHLRPRSNFSIDSR